MNTRITELFSTDIPIVSGGMVWCSGWRLASAVSNAGGLGLIGAGSMSEEVLSQHIELCRQATAGTFGVNIPLMNANSAKHIECVMKHKVPVVFTSAGNPALYTARLKEAGCKVVHVVANEKFALKAQSAGCDAVVAEGFEAGGHNGKEETTTLVLIQQLAGRLTLPLIAAGGLPPENRWLPSWLWVQRACKWAVPLLLRRKVPPMRHSNKPSSPPRKATPNSCFANSHRHVC